MRTKHKIQSMILVIICIGLIFSFNMVNAEVMETVKYNSNIPITLHDIPEVIPNHLVKDNQHIQRLYTKETDLNTIMFQNSDDTATLYYFKDDVKFVDKSGKIKDKSNRLYSLSDSTEKFSKYTYANLDNNIQTYFPTILSKDTGILLTYDKINLQVSPYTTSVSDVSKCTDLHQKSDAVEYDYVFGPDTKLRYTPTFTGFKEDIILYSNIGNEFSFLLKTEDFKAEAQSNGQINIVDDLNNIIAVIDPVYVYDSFTQMSDSVLVDDNYIHSTWNNIIELEELEKGAYKLTIKVDEDFLNDDRTVYPVYVDPTFNINTAGSGTSKTIHDVPIYNGSGAQNLASGGNTYNLIGYAGQVSGVDYGIGRTLIKFPGLLQNETYKKLYSNAISNVTLYAYEASGLSQPATIYAYQYTGSTWTESSARYTNVSWNGYSTPSTSVTIGSTSQVTASFNITNIVKGWLSNPLNGEKGIMLKNANESTAGYRKDFRSTESSSKPYIAITYTVKNLSARIYYDSSTSYTSTQLNSYYTSGASSFETEFFVKFNRSSTTLNSLLNGSSCPNTTNTDICSSTCGTVSGCNNSHHKGSGRLLGIGTSSSIYTYRLVGHKVCYYSTTHSEVVGLGNVNGKNAITSLISSSNIARSIQHELSHNLGASHSTCNTSQKCVLDGYFGYWCDNCRANIKKNL